MSEWLKGWLASEETSHDKIEVKRIYIDLNEGNLYDGVIFSQIMYWHGASKETGKPRMTIEKEGHLWLAKGYGDWFVECRIGEATARQCISRIEKRGLIIKKLWKFDKTPTIHIRIDWDCLEEQLKWICYDTSIRFDTTYQIGFDTTPQMDLIPEVKSLTETTASTTTETTSKKKRITQKDCDALIDVWASILKLNADVMGSNYHSTSARRHAKEMLLWPRPPTRQEFELVIKESGKDYIPFEFLSGAIIKLRAKKPAAINPAHVPFATTSPEGEAYVPQPAEARAALQSLTKTVKVNDEVLYAKLAKSA